MFTLPYKVSKIPATYDVKKNKNERKIWSDQCFCETPFLVLVMVVVLPEHFRGLLECGRTYIHVFDLDIPLRIKGALNPNFLNI